MKTESAARFEIAHDLEMKFQPLDEITDVSQFSEKDLYQGDFKLITSYKGVNKQDIEKSWSFVLNSSEKKLIESNPHVFLEKFKATSKIQKYSHEELLDFLDPNRVEKYEKQLDARFEGAEYFEIVKCFDWNFIVSNTGRKAFSLVSINYINGDLTESRYDLQGVAEHLIKQENVVIRDHKGSIIDHKNDSEKIIVYVPHYNREECRRQTIYFTFTPSDDQAIEIKNKLTSMQKYIGPVIYDHLMDEVLGLDKYKTSNKKGLKP